MSTSKSRSRTKTVAAPERQRDAAGTRSRIVAAAERLFSRHGYDHVGVREIASDAGVSAALVNRYFGSKEKLFTEIAANAFDIDDVTQGPISEWGERTARFLTSIPPRGSVEQGLDPFHFLLGSALSPIAAPIVTKYLYTRFVVPLAERIEADDARLRASLVAAYILGFALTHATLRMPGIKANDKEKVVTLLGSALQSCFNGDRDHAS